MEMAKLNLGENEKMIAQAAASHIVKFMMLPQANPGTLYVTNLRVSFDPSQGRDSSAFEHALEEIASFSTGMANTINLRLKNGEEHKITGMFNKKLIEALQSAGVSRA